MKILTNKNLKEETVLQLEQQFGIELTEDVELLQLPFWDGKERVLEILELVNFPYIHVGSMYKDDWKKIPILVNKGTQFLFINEGSYVHNLTGELESKYGGSITDTSGIKFLTELIVKIKSGRPAIKVEDEVTRTLKELAGENYKTYIKLLAREDFKQQIDIICRGLEIDVRLTRDIIKEYTDIDVYKSKLCQILYYQQYPDLSYIREFNDESRAEDFIKALKNIVNLEVDLEDIYEDVEQVILDQFQLNDRLWKCPEQEDKIILLRDKYEAEPETAQDVYIEALEYGRAYK